MTQSNSGSDGAVAGNVQGGLPHEIIERDSRGGDRPATRRRGEGGIRKLRWLLLVPLLLFLGAVIGMYFQPPALKKFFALTGLTPGAGTSAPIALPPSVEVPQDVIDTLQVTDVLGLARLMPRGDISPVAAPSGAGDARIAEILVAAGDRLEKGQPVAVLDNLGQLEGAVLSAEALVSVREASLLQTRQFVQTSQAESRAALEQAQAAADAAKSDRLRAEDLFGRGVTTQAVLDAAVSADLQADRVVQKARATLSRFASENIETQPDVVVAARNLDAAAVDLERARRDLDRSRVVTPIAGVVLAIHAQPGEHPPQNGIMEIGNTSQMMAEVEIYQDHITMVETGQPVEIVSNAIGQTLTGVVSQIGLLVGRQDMVSSDTAANTDARVIEVLVRLDPASSAVAARYTNLEAVARIDTRAVPGTGADAGSDG